MLTDTDAKWAASLGLDKDLSAAGLGQRTWRFAIVIDDLVVKYLGVRDRLSSVAFADYDNVFNRSSLAPVCRSLALPKSSQNYKRSLNYL